MRYTPLLLAQAAMSLGFLIVPPADISPSMLLDPAALDRVMLFRMPCPDCPGADKQDLDLGFEFVIPPEDPTKVLVNGQSVLPINPEGNTGLTAVMIPREDDMIDYITKGPEYPIVPLDYSLMVAGSVAEQDIEHRTDSIELRVYGVDGKPVHVDGLIVGVTESITDGTMAIDSAYQTPAKPPCKTMKCLLDSVVEKMAHPIKNFRKPCHGQGRKMHGLDAPEGHHPHHGHHRTSGHGHHHGHHHHHEESFVSIIMIPVVAGLCVGFLVFLVGLTIGHLVRFAVMKARNIKSRGCPRNRRKLDQQDVEAGDKEAAAGLLEAEEEIEAPPAYKDDAGVVVTEKE